MQYRECPHCGAHLDPGEVCDCRQPRDEQVSREPQSKTYIKPAVLCDASGKPLTTKSANRLIS